MQSPSVFSPMRSLRAVPAPLVRVAAVAATVSLLAMSVPLVWAAVSAGLGLVALTAVAAGGVVLFQAMSWAMQRLENRLLQMRKHEAGASPIEQLENDLLRRAQRLAEFRAALATVGGQIESIRQMLDERRHKDPGHVLERQQRAMQRLIDFYAANLARLDQAQIALADFKCTVDRKNSEWMLAQAIGAAHKALDPDTAETLVEDLLSDAAIRAVQDRFNTAFAELDIQLRGDAATGPLQTGGSARQLPGALAVAHRPVPGSTP